MFNEKNNNLIIEDFIKHLEVKSLSRKSIRNYKSDLTHFKTWLSEREILGFYLLTSSHIRDYIDYLVSEEVSKKTINRKLSTLRSLSNYLVRKGIAESDFMAGVNNLRKPKEKQQKHLLNSYVYYLRSQKISNKTIRNYRSDIEQFLKWLEKRNVQLTEIRPRDMKLYCIELAKERSLATVKRHISSLKKFISWNEGVSDDKNIYELSPYYNGKSWSTAGVFLVVIAVVALTQGLKNEKSNATWQGVLTSEKEVNLSDYEKLNQKNMNQNSVRWPSKQISIALAREPMSKMVDENEVALNIDSSLDNSSTDVSDLSLELDKSIVGSSYIQARHTETTIYDNRVNKFSYIYLTPTSSTGGQSLFIKTQGRGYFVVGIDNFLEKDINFNWWVSNQ